MDAELHIQDFETSLLGVTVGRLVLADDENAGDLEDLISEWRDDSVWLVSCRVAVGASTLTQLKQVGFRQIETLVTFRRDIPRVPSEAEMELATPEDEAACVALSLQAFTQDRFHSDPEVPDWAADRVRAAWVRNDLNGRANACFVVRADGAVAGFNLCLLDGNEAIIDLVAVDISQRQQGFGTWLVTGAVDFYSGRAETMRVGTQADNAPSLALYRGAGFTEVRRQETLHWVNADAAPAEGARGS